MTEMVANFQRKRWGTVRKIIDQLNVGGTAPFHQTRANTVQTTTRRLQDAYGDREYKVRKDGDYLVVTRIK